MDQSLYLLLITVISIVLLLILVMRFKIHAFISLIIVSAFVGISAGMPFDAVLNSIQEGMAGILGFIAIIVGLGSIMGKMLEVSGGAEALARNIVALFGTKRTPWSMTITGFIISIPVFLDVGFIILVPIIYALARKSKKSTLYYAIPLLAGMLVTHAFIPPTPGPTAVAEIIGVPLGWVIIFGVITGIPAAILAGPIFGRRSGFFLTAATASSTGTIRLPVLLRSLSSTPPPFKASRPGTAVYHQSCHLLRELGVDGFLGEGRFTAPDRVGCDGARDVPWRSRYRLESSNEGCE
jgi:H+/gluconate symporter-like permease